MAPAAATQASQSSSSSSTVAVSSAPGIAPQHRADLSWAPSPSLVDGYEVYRSTRSGGPYLRLTASPVAIPAFTDTSVLAGQTYYYVVTAVAASVESGYSNEITATIPSP